MATAITVSILMCFLLVGIVRSNSNHRHIVHKISPKPIRTSDSVSTALGLPSIPTELLNVVVKAAISLVQKTSLTATDLTRTASPGLEQNALQDCIELLDDTTDHLTQTLSSLPGLLGGGDFPISNVETFLSAGLTNQETCMDGFSNTNGAVKSQVEGGVEQISQSVSNALGIVKTITDLAGTNRMEGSKSPSHHRRLLYHGSDFPAWLSAVDRSKLLLADVRADAVVAQDGTGNHTTITDAVNNAPDKSDRKYVIYVKAGVYAENVEIGKKKTNLMLVGDGVDSTTVTGNRSVGDGTTTYRSATFAVKGPGFIARDITFENTAGPSKHQAVALRVGSDLSVFYRCSIKGYQDTLYIHSLRQFYRECNIYGTVDFIFGNAAAVLQSCVIMARKPLDRQTITITAQGRKDANQNTGISIHDCNITAAPDFVPVKGAFQTYLGRPWKKYSRTVLLQSYLDEIVHPSGWARWNASDFALDTLYYGEYMNYGPGAGLAARIQWPGYHVLNFADANTFTVSQFIEGNKWLPSTGITYFSGLKA